MMMNEKHRRKVTRALLGVPVLVAALSFAAQPATSQDSSAAASEAAEPCLAVMATVSAPGRFIPPTLVEVANPGGQSDDCLATVSAPGWFVPPVLGETIN
jgi:hypothetical protein